jgi:hypothetical protein
MEKPDACTLPTSDLPLRLAEFTDLFTSSLIAVDRPTPEELRLRLAAAAEATTRDLVRRETACCSFFDFTVTAGDDVTLDVRVPGSRVAVLDGLERLALAR